MTEWVPWLVLSPFVVALAYLFFVVWQDYRRRRSSDSDKR